MKSIGLAIALLGYPLLMSSCGKAEAQSVPRPELTLRVQVVEEKDADGVASASCPPGYRVTGGGCSCAQATQAVFSAMPGTTGTFYLCGCTPPPSGDGSVTARAVCLGGEGYNADLEIRARAEGAAMREHLLQQRRLAAHSQAPR
jgi:hypothetical protein